MSRALARYHQAALMVGQGSTDITPDIAQLLSNTVDVQLAFLDNFVRVIEAAAEPQWAMWNARAQQYALSPKSSWAEGDVIRQAGRVLPLPAMPCQGTQCGNNCLCAWKIEKTGDNSYTAAWIRHADDSCQTCVIRGDEWKMLVIEDGALLP